MHSLVMIKKAKCQQVGGERSKIITTVFPRSDAAATINFPLLALAATIRGQRLIEAASIISIILYTIGYCLAASILIVSCSKYYFW